MNILGISALYHDSAACLVQDGKIVAAVSEERFTRKKHYAGIPAKAMAYCLSAGGIEQRHLDYVVFYDKPLTKFFRLIRTYQEIAPFGFRSFRKAMSSWITSKLWTSSLLEDQLESLGYACANKLLFLPHHLSHASSAFFPSPFESAAVLTMDGVGEWATTTIGIGDGANLQLIQQQRFPHSLGLLYSAFTWFAGFKVNSGEHKLMGLAPYGRPTFAKLIRDELLDLKDDGSFRLNLRYFDFLGGLTMTNSRFAGLFGGPPRKPETPITQREMDLARSIQEVTEEIVLRLARHAKSITNKSDLCMAGGVALNCVANGLLLRKKVFERMWIQPAAGDAGGALGAALYAWHTILGNQRSPNALDAMEGSYLGPSFSEQEIKEFLDKHGYPYTYILVQKEWADRIAEHLERERVVAVFQGRMEFGPRALGNRSILGDPRSPKMQSVMNLKIKYRESFRPFAPAVLSERATEFFELEIESPYMLLTAPVRTDRRVEKQSESGQRDDLIQWVNEVRSDIPAVTHVDYSARIQTVTKERNPRFHQILQAFEKKTGCGVLINTSFNVRGEPIVCTPNDAYRCFMRSEIDVLILENFMLEKSQQPPYADANDWRSEFELD